MKRPLLHAGFAILFGAATMLHAEEKLFIAVLDLVGQNFSQQEAVVVSEQLRVELMKSGSFRIVERSQMETILKEQGFQQSGCTDDACAVEMGQMLGVKNMVVGSLGQAGSYTMLTIRMLDVATGEVILTESNRTKGGVDAVIENGVNDIAVKLSGSYKQLSGKAVAKQAPAAPPVPVVTPAPAEPAAPVIAETPAVAETKPAPRKKGNKVVGLALLGGMVVGGGVAAYLVFGNKKTSETPGSQTTEMTDVEVTFP